MKASIEVDSVSLSVPIYLQRERRVNDWGRMFLGAAFDPPRRQLIRLLDDISFTAEEGDRVAILGRNGAGKSTLLRVLNGVYAPTAGRVQISGTCQALLNMSLGFNGDATVRENIFLRGTAMGLGSGQLREQIEPILDFSGLYEKSNHRLHTLSAGQRMRLGFAICTSIQHDVILMDEWVGAGDSEFMAKAADRMRDRVGGSKIVMLSSHSTGLLRGICNKGIVLEGGRLVFAGDIVSALKCYHDLLASLRAEPEKPLEQMAGELTYGCVENIEIEAGMARLQGWCVNASGAASTALVLEFGGARHAATRVERYRRPDVKRHFGLSDDHCGFRATFQIPLLASMADIGPHLRVMGGDQSEQANCPLRIAGSVTEALRTTP